MCSSDLGEVGFGAFGVGVVGECRHAVAGGFGEADVAGDDGLEHQVAEMLEKLFADFDDEAAAAVVEGADDAGDVELLLQIFLLNFALLNLLLLFVHF